LGHFHNLTTNSKDILHKRRYYKNIGKIQDKKNNVFYVFSYLMDEISTLTLMKTGGTEANLFVAWMIQISPLLWMFTDLIIFLLYYVFDAYMRNKVWPPTFTVFWLIAGSARLSCCIWNYSQILIRFWF